MKCINCNKVIPSSLEVCPNCGKDPYVKDLLEFGTIDDVNYGKDSDLKINFLEEKNIKKKVMPIGIALVVILIVIFGVITIINKNKVYTYQITNSFIDKISEIVENKIDELYEGSYTLDVKVNNEEYNINGNYSYEIASRYINVDGKLQDPNKKNVGIILKDKDLEFKLVENGLTSYFNSESIYDKPILLPLDNLSLYLNKKVDYASLNESITDALKKSLKAMSFSNTKTSYNYKNENINVTKSTLVMNNKVKYNFLNNFLGELKDDSSFITEFSKITALKEDDLIKYLKNYIDNASYGVNDGGEDIVINIYSKGLNIYEINYNNLYILKIVDDLYNFSIKDKKGEIINITISKKSEEHQDYLESLYDFNISYYNNSVIGTLKLKDNLDPKLNKTDFEDYINLNDISVSDKNLIKERFNYYFKNNDIIDKIFLKLKVRCTKGLECSCDDNELCTCLYQDKMIKCDYNLIK